MRSLTHTLIGAGLALLVAAGAHAQSFQYTTATTAGLGPVDVGSGNIVQFFPAVSKTPASASSSVGGSEITLFSMQTLAVAPTDTPNNVNYAHTVTLNIYDATGATLLGTRAIGFQLGGDAGTVNGAPAAHMTNNITSGLPYTFTTGGYDFTVTPIVPTAAPTVPDAPRVGVNVNVVARASGIPEPSSLALLGTGLLPLCGLLRRRRA